MSCEGRAFQSAVAPSNSPMAHLVVLLVDARNEKEGSVALVHDLLVSPLDEIAHLRRTPQHHRRDLADDPDLVPRAVGLVPLRTGTPQGCEPSRASSRWRLQRARARLRAGGAAWGCWRLCRSRWLALVSRVLPCRLTRSRKLICAGGRGQAVRCRNGAAPTIATDGGIHSSPGRGRPRRVEDSIRARGTG